jgi:Retroviral aspartyl protease
VSFLTVETIQGKRCRLPFKCLFDPGSDSSFITAKAVPKNCNWERVKSHSFQVLGGVAPTMHQVHLKNIALPEEFSRSIRTSHSFRCYLNHDNDCPYDIILGLDFLTPVGINVMCSQQKVRWQDKEIPFHPRDSFDSPDQMLQALLDAINVPESSYSNQDDDDHNLSELGYNIPKDKILSS